MPEQGSRAPPHAYQQWQNMISLGKYTIKDMLTDVDSQEESYPPSTIVSKKGRNRKSHQAKLKAKAESEESDTTDDKSTKSAGGKGVKRRKDHNLLVQNRILS